MADEEPKIIIDEDWKAQVQREKDEADVPAEDAPVAGAEAEEPPANFVALVSSLATQCMFALGLIQQQEGGQVMVDIQGAKFLIDLLIVLRDKTEGNLEPDEEGAITEAISELQRAYVVRAQQVQEASMKEAGIDMTNLHNPDAPPTL